MDVCKCAICRLLFSLSSLHCTHLDLHLLASFFRKLLHVMFDEFNLGVQVRIADASVFEFLLELKVPQLQLLDHFLVLFLSLLHVQVGIGQLIELLRELGKFLVKFVH